MTGKMEENRGSLMVDSFLTGLNEQRERKERESDSFWAGHSRFQISRRVLRYKGKSESLVLVYLYERASSISFYSTEAVLIEIKVQEEKIAERTGICVRAVSLAIISLEVDGCIKVSRHRDPLTKKIKTSVYVLLHSETREPLTSSPKNYGVCEENRDLPYITAPKETREKIVQMNPSGRQVYLAALFAASVRVATSFGIPRDEWKLESGLGRNAFDRGLKECTAKGLLSYRRYVLTLSDPATGAPSKRVRGRIEHENPKWEFDLDEVKAETWRAVVERLMQRRFVIGSNGWSNSARETFCPFCKEARSFRVHFGTAEHKCEFKCHACARYGRLGKLIQKLLGTTKMSEVKDILKEEINRSTTLAA